jgi:hypothetical protein
MLSGIKNCSYSTQRIYDYLFIYHYTLIILNDNSATTYYHSQEKSVDSHTSYVSNHFSENKDGVNVETSPF